MQGQVQVHIEAPPDKVYAMVSDVTRMPEWSPECVKAEWVGGATGPAVGAKFKGTNKRRLPWSTTPEVTVADPGREFAFNTGDTVWRYVFTAAGSGTDVTESYEAKPIGGFMKLLTRLATGAKDREADLAENMRTTLERLKAAAEKG